MFPLASNLPEPDLQHAGPAPLLVTPRPTGLLTPRQAAALAATLDLWSDLEIPDWLTARDYPLHDPRPFDMLDRPSRGSDSSPDASVRRTVLCCQSRLGVRLFYC